ncbi:DUF2231 domain-containing protein [Raineyella fluvialis]|uniref:DUF2231 domain-containing protein n=1 Tax=Raineyella fluvialis TaxID=2662261 RepID=A0A5Q2FHJ9_9ACTN|nr:DUF2231 domain-containing protein [Raineyella fluvialis]QGF24613.1 hypothetical protein Rai3103_14335 [Raineyella fluvialis]
MFDVIFGLPVHILVLHAYVVLGPLAAAAAIAYAARPAWRRILKWPVVVLAVVTGVSAFVTKESGEKLQGRLVPRHDSGSTDPQVRAILAHTEIGDVAGIVGILFMLVVLVAVLWALRERAGERAQGFLAVAAVVVVIVAAASLLVSVVWAGHTGAVAAWQARIAATTPGSGD